MSRTRPVHLVLVFAVGAIALWLLEIGLAASGRAVVIPPFTLAVALVLIGVIVVLMALPVRRVAKGVPNARVDPFYATRVVVIAKASSLAGALVAGGGAAIGVYLLTRAVVASFSSVSMAFGTAIGAVVLVAGGLIAEHMCAIPPSEDDDPDAPSAAR